MDPDDWFLIWPTLHPICLNLPYPFSISSGHVYAVVFSPRPPLPVLYSGGVSNTTKPKGWNCCFTKLTLTSPPPSPFLPFPDTRQGRRCAKFRLKYFTLIWLWGPCCACRCCAGSRLVVSGGLLFLICLSYHNWTILWKRTPLKSIFCLEKVLIKKNSWSVKLCGGETVDLVHLSQQWYNSGVI